MKTYIIGGTEYMGSSPEEAAQKARSIAGLYGDLRVTDAETGEVSVSYRHRYSNQAMPGDRALYQDADK